MFETERLAAVDALVQAADAVRNWTGDAIAGLAQFFPNETDAFAGELLTRLELAQRNLVDAKIEVYTTSVQNPAIFFISPTNKPTVHDLGTSSRKGKVPAFAFPPKNIYIMQKWYDPDIASQRPGIIAHEAFHLEFKQRNGLYEAVTNHAKKTKLDAFAYQGFVCFIANLPQAAPLDKYPGPYASPESSR